MVVSAARVHRGSGSLAVSCSARLGAVVSKPASPPSSAVCDVPMPAASGATMPDAEIVATVAEPVARRMPTATSQPRNGAEMFAPPAA